MMIDRTFVAEEQSILNRLREQETKLNGNYACYQLFLNRYNYKNKYMYIFDFSWDYESLFYYIFLNLYLAITLHFYEHVYFK